MNMIYMKFSAPVLDDSAQELYTRLYGDAGDRYVGILDTSPAEIAVISRMIAYLRDKKEA